MSSKRIHYDAALKREVIIYAEEHGNRAAQRNYKISEANIRRWRKDREPIFTCKTTTKCFSGPKKGRFPEVDKAVLKYITEARANGLPVNRHMIQSKATEVVKTLGIDEAIFKARRGWCDRFLRREGVLLKCRKYKTSEKNPANMRSSVKKETPEDAKRNAAAKEDGREGHRNDDLRCNSDSEESSSYAKPEFVNVKVEIDDEEYDMT